MSIPNLWGHVVRHQSITLRGTSPHGKEVVLKLTDMEAVVPQHEIDHLDGILFIDKSIPKSLNWFAKKIGIPLSAEFEDILKNEDEEGTQS
jgi:peptide deformylase